MVENLVSYLLDGFVVNETILAACIALIVVAPPVTGIVVT